MSGEQNDSGHSRVQHVTGHLHTFIQCLSLSQIARLRKCTELYRVGHINKEKEMSSELVQFKCELEKHHDYVYMTNKPSIEFIKRTCIIILYCFHFN